VTCHDARPWLSDLLDEALEPARRAEVEAHLLTCPECRLELEGLRATVAMLHRVEPARAPAGFVDRVMQRAIPTPWHRRVAAWLFLPLSIKLPAQAAAIVVIAGLAMLLIERTPELRDAARLEPPAPRSTPEAPPQPPPTPRAQEAREAPRAKVAPVPPRSRSRATRDAPSDEAATAPPRGGETPGASSEQMASAPPAPAPPAPPEPAQAPAAPAAPAAPTPSIPAPPAARPRVVGEPFDAKPDRTEVQKRSSAPALSRANSPTASPADVAGRLKVTDRPAAVAGLTELLSKVGGSEIARRQDGSETVIEVLVPEARYDELVRGLEGLGSWSAPGLPQRVMRDAPYLRVPIRIAE
jgi:hypothetical protein